LQDNQDKLAWCEAGKLAEGDFLATRSIEGWGLSWNPAKHSDPYSHDFVGIVPMDLKTMTTQWIKSHEIFGISSEHAISINEKDFKRYASLYPNIIILCDVQWLKRVFTLTLPRARRLLREGKAHRHEYLERKNDDKGNARVSYVFNVNDLDELL